MFVARSDTYTTLLKYPLSRLILPIPLVGISESSLMRMDGKLYGCRDEKESYMEAMFLEAPESMMKEEYLEDPITSAWHLSLSSEFEPPSFFLAPSSRGMLLFSRSCTIMSMIFFMHALSGCRPL